MIAYIWFVYPYVSTLPLVATGMSSEKHRAKEATEDEMRKPTAAFGMIQPVSISLEVILASDDLVADWPPVGVGEIAQRKTDGSVVWKPAPEKM